MNPLATNHGHNFGHGIDCPIRGQLIAILQLIISKIPERAIVIGFQWLAYTTHNSLRPATEKYK